MIISQLSLQFADTVALFLFFLFVLNVLLGDPFQPSTLDSELLKVLVLVCHYLNK